MQKEVQWKVECPKPKDKKEKHLSDAASVAEGVENVLSISTSSVGDTSIPYSGCTYNICPN